MIINPSFRFYPKPQKGFQTSLLLGLVKLSLTYQNYVNSPEILSHQKVYQSIFSKEICQEEAERQGLQLIMFSWNYHKIPNFFVFYTTISEYISSKGLAFRQNGKERNSLYFNDCDKDSTGNEAHLYIGSENGLFHCKKCITKGNIVTIAKHFGDDITKLGIDGYEPPKKMVI